MHPSLAVPVAAVNGKACQLFLLSFIRPVINLEQSSLPIPLLAASAFLFSSFFTSFSLLSTLAQRQVCITAAALPRGPAARSPFYYMVFIYSCLFIYFPSTTIFSRTPFKLPVCNERHWHAHPFPQAYADNLRTRVHFMRPKNAAERTLTG